MREGRSSYSTAATINVASSSYVFALNALTSARMAACIASAGRARWFSADSTRRSSANSSPAGLRLSVIPSV